MGGHFLNILYQGSRTGCYICLNLVELHMLKYYGELASVINFPLSANLFNVIQLFQLCCMALKILLLSYVVPCPKLKS